MQSSFGAITPYLTGVKLPSCLGSRGPQVDEATRPRCLRALEVRRLQSPPTTLRGEGLLHDARNLVGTIGLYCDLLSMPGVLKPEHRQYPEELRLLGTRSKSLIDHLMKSLFAMEGEVIAPKSNSAASATNPSVHNWKQTRESIKGCGDTVKPMSLRSVVERCSGLLSRVANVKVLEISYGPAASVPIKVREEAVERILINLVRNAAAATGTCSSADNPSALEAPGRTAVPIRILVGPLVSSVGEHKPWPFQRVRLVVEDAGKGMNPQQLERLLGVTGARSRGDHGIGFGVVRDLVAASNGEIRVLSEPEMGTSVQIEWPIIAMARTGNGMIKMEIPC